MFHPYLGKILILTNIFQMGWNHQLENQFLLRKLLSDFFCLKKVQALWVELLLWFTSPHQLVVARFEIQTKEETGRSPQNSRGRLKFPRICDEFVNEYGLRVLYLKIMRGKNM